MDTSLGDKVNPSFTLSGINVQVKRGEVLAVVGPVASGKSILIQGLLGDVQSLNETMPLLIHCIHLLAHIVNFARLYWVFMQIHRDLCNYMLLVARGLPGFTWKGIDWLHESAMIHCIYSGCWSHFWKQWYFWIRLFLAISEVVKSYRWCNVLVLLWNS